MKLNRTFGLSMLLCSSLMLLVQCKKDTPSQENKAPIAKVIPINPITLPINTITLDGSTSNDPDGTIKSYKWTKITSPVGDNSKITNSDTVNTTVTNLIEGNYSFMLTVTDNVGTSSSVTINVIVNKAGTINKLPVAQAGVDQTIILPTNTITLDGSASSDPDGTIQKYVWSKIAAPVGDASIITTPSVKTTAVTGLIVGNYRFELAVTDDKGAFTMDTVNVTVMSAQINQPPVARAGSDQTIILPVTTATLNGSTSNDPDGNIQTYAWTKIKVPTVDASVITMPSGATTTVTGLSAGNYSFKLIVTDDKGFTSSDTINVAVVDQTPIARAANMSIALPASTVMLDGSSSTNYDNTKTGLTYEWTYAGDVSVTPTITNSKTATPTITGLTAAGKYNFLFTVTNSVSGKFASIHVSVVVDPLVGSMWVGKKTVGTADHSLSFKIDSETEMSVSYNDGASISSGYAPYTLSTGMDGKVTISTVPFYLKSTKAKMVIKGEFITNNTQLNITSMKNGMDPEEPIVPVVLSKK